MTQLKLARAASFWLLATRYETEGDRAAFIFSPEVSDKIYRKEI